ncbi:GntR family transcriptional regulator [Nocardioides sp. 616]|uniref:GntR family transcriptional regulator n=1 Tax=Nocardioides sp. 616 TaxID=2268090 RepID=UPI000CE35D3E|nr:GntR family transcriptional regulator [Nocardioides sp. 616]
MTETPLAHVDRDDPEPPFEQVRRQIAGKVASGELAPGTRLPTVRALADQLGLAVNTAARVYKELEADGVVETRGRHGTVVRGSAAAAGAGAVQAADEFVAQCRRLGIQVSDAVRLVTDRWPR